LEHPDEIGKRLQRTPPHAGSLRQGRGSIVRANEVRNEVCEADANRLMQAFGMALTRGDVEGLAAMLAEDAEFLSDGGGIVAAVPKPLHGGELIAKVLIGFAKLADWTRVHVEPARINGWPGGVLYDADGTAIQTLTLRFAADGRVAAVYVTRNPQKLAHLHRSSVPGRGLDASEHSRSAAGTCASDCSGSVRPSPKQ
jgi:RNA polymerase sigma-70 factor, ECF subfamily